MTLLAKARHSRLNPIVARSDRADLPVGRMAAGPADSRTSMRNLTLRHVI
jgi:hypothetical protein